MKQIVKTTGIIMQQLRMLTGWNFIGGVKGKVCTLSASLINKEGKKVNITLEIERNDVLIKATTWNDTFDQEVVDRVTGRLDFPIEVELEEGKSFTISHHEPLGVLEHSVRGVVIDCIVPMANAVAEAVAAPEDLDLPE